MALPLAVLATALLNAACTPAGGRGLDQSDSAKLAAREARLEESLAAAPDSGDELKKPIARWVLPPSLAEISGMALTEDDRLLVHNDEVGRVQEINYRTGTLGKHFTLSPEAREDFEGITVAGGNVYLLASTGRLFEFKEGASGARVPYNVHDTKLGHECEFEGVAFDPAINSLLLACKVVRTKSRQGSVLIYRWKLDGSGDDRLSELAVPLEQVVGSHKWKGYNPSDIAVDPSSGNYVLVSAQEEALVELTPAGQVVSVRPLPKQHTRTEGLAISKDGILLVSDEAAPMNAAITLYRWRGPAPGRVASPSDSGNPASPAAKPTRP